MDFKQAQKRFKQLKAQFETGVLPETEFKNQLEQLMIQDKHGSWWMIGYETGRWYRHDGTNWVQTDLSDSASQKSISIPFWAVIFWIMLGCATGSAIGIAISGAIAEKIGLVISWAVGGAIGGAIEGFSIATALRAQNTLSDWKNMLWITLAWTIGGAISIVPISWAIGGLVTAVTLRIENILSDGRNMFWITLAWTVGGAIGWAISRAISAAIAGDLGWVIGWAVGGALGGATGGAVMIWQIRKGKSQVVPTW